jgi:hypothetical protein
VVLENLAHLGGVICAHVSFIYVDWG